MKTYRRHYCAKRHRTYATAAKCLWRRAAWITGNGPYATLAWCRTLTVELHADVESAEAAKRTIDDTACGGRCQGATRHEIIRLVEPSAMEAAA